MDVVIPWNRPGYLIGPHPLVLAYLHHSQGVNVIYKKEYALDNMDQRLQRVKRRVSEMLLRTLATVPQVSLDAMLEFFTNRASLNLSELFMDDPNLLVFNHATPYPLESKFVLHYENPSTLFFPFLWYSAGRDFRLYNQPYFHLTKALLESDSCKLIFCHMNIFKEKLERVFKSDVINRKTRLIRPHIPILNDSPRKQVRTVMFSNSFNSSDERFFLRGGLAAVSAFLNISRKYPDARLFVFSNLPSSLSEPLKAELIENKNVIVVKPGVSEQEMSSLCAEVDVLLNPSTGLHSMTILRGMSAGAVVITSDIVGNDEYITSGHNGIIVPGVRERVNFTDPESGLSLEDYSNYMAINQEFIQPLTDILDQIFIDPEKYHPMRVNAVRHIAENFSYGTKNCNLWEVLSGLDS